MTLPHSPWQPENDVERLLCSLAGVVSARVVANPLGRLDEIHILASPLLNPKQVVRNVESALAAGLGIIIDRRIISVAQIRREALEPALIEVDFGSPTTDAQQQDGDESLPPVPPAQRIVFVGWDARAQPGIHSECRVTVRRDGQEFTGVGSAAGTQQGRALAAARALFRAIAETGPDYELVLEDARLVDAHERAYALVSARALVGRESRPLTGVAAVSRSPEEAAILASLQATNRWTGQDD